MRMTMMRYKRNRVFKAAVIFLLTLLLGAGCMSPAFAQSKEGADSEAAQETEKKKKDKEDKKKKAEEETEEAVIDRSGLTPDGNMDLVDDLQGDQTQEMEFLTVTTKNGHTFYVVIEKGKETANVHFLNQVDEADLMELLSEEEKEEMAARQEETEKEEILPPMQNMAPETTDQSQAESQPAAASENVQVQGINTAQLFAAIAIITALAGGLAYWVLKLRSEKNRQYYDEDIEFEDDPEYENEDKEEPGAGSEESSSEEPQQDMQGDQPAEESGEAADVEGR